MDDNKFNHDANSIENKNEILGGAKEAQVVEDKTTSFASSAGTPIINKKPSGNKKSNPSMTIAIAISVLSLLFACGSGAVAIIALNKSDSSVTTSTVSSDGYYSGNTVEFEETSIAAIAEKVTPAVVSIISTSGSSSYGNSWYDYLYGSGATQSAGTGMIVSSDGYVITNKHVISDADEIQIVTDAGDTYDDVTIVGEDPLNDVAYLKINNVSDLPTVTLGDSKTMAVGQPVLAIGNALGAYQNSVTSGIISGTGRSVTASDSDGSNTETLTDMIQTDAAINPGNSGGPLVNANGDVIGINTAVSSDSNGIGFAIPIASVKGMLKNITENNDDGRAYIGLSYITITSEVAKTYDLSVKQGAYVHIESSSSRRNSSAVLSGGPADKAGIKDGDILTKINGVEIGTAGSVVTLIGEYKVGDTIEVTLLRDGEEKTVKVTLEAYPTSYSNR